MNLDLFTSGKQVKKKISEVWSLFLVKLCLDFDRCEVWVTLSLRTVLRLIQVTGVTVVPLMATWELAQMSDIYQFINLVFKTVTLDYPFISHLGDFFLTDPFFLMV